MVLHVSLGKHLADVGTGGLHGLGVYRLKLCPALHGLLKLGIKLDIDRGAHGGCEGSPGPDRPAIFPLARGVPRELAELDGRDTYVGAEEGQRPLGKNGVRSCFADWGLYLRDAGLPPAFCRQPWWD